jgi:hypothetical protein
MVYVDDVNFSRLWEAMDRDLLSDSDEELIDADVEWSQSGNLKQC